MTQPNQPDLRLHQQLDSAASRVRDFYSITAGLELGALKTTILLNGGALVATTTLFAATTIPDALHAALLRSVWAWTSGATIGAIAYVPAFFAATLFRQGEQWYYYALNMFTDHGGTEFVTSFKFKIGRSERFLKQATIMQWLGMFLVIVSIINFAGGFWIIAESINSAVASKSL